MTDDEIRDRIFKLDCEIAELRAELRQRAGLEVTPKFTAYDPTSLLITYGGIFHEGSLDLGFLSDNRTTLPQHAAKKPKKKPSFRLVE